MKLSDNFDARRLRSRIPGAWRFRLGTILALLFILIAFSLALTGAASLLGQPATLHGLNENLAAARIMVFVGVALFFLGLFIWRRCRRRLRQTNNLSLSPHLMKRRD